MLSRLIQSSFSVAFPRQSKIRRLANDFEDFFKNHYLQPQIIPVPDELDPEVPRLIFDSHHGFSQMIISQISITMTAVYSPDWQQDRARGRDYFLQRSSLVLDSLKLLENAPAHFCGINNRLLITGYTDIQSSLDDLINIAKIERPGRNTADLEIKTTHIIDDRFFSNATLRNFLAWSLQHEIEGVIRQPRAEAVDFGIEVISDFNDRYAFNEKSDYQVDQEGMLLVVTKGFAELDRLERLFKGAKNCVCDAHYKHLE